MKEDGSTTGTGEVRSTAGRKVFDKNGRMILPGDVLKLFHFIGARRKRHYIYKQALAYERGRLKISHLNRLDDEPWKIGTNYYTESADNLSRPEYEIVQTMTER